MIILKLFFFNFGKFYNIKFKDFLELFYIIIYFLFFLILINYTFFKNFDKSIIILTENYEINHFFKSFYIKDYDCFINNKFYLNLLLSSPLIIIYSFIQLFLFFKDLLFTKMYRTVNVFIIFISFIYIFFNLFYIFFYAPGRFEDFINEDLFLYKSNYTMFFNFEGFIYTLILEYFLILFLLIGFIFYKIILFIKFKEFNIYDTRKLLYLIFFYIINLCFSINIFFVLIIILCIEVFMYLLFLFFFKKI